MARFGRYTVDLTSQDKVLFPDSGITKGDVVDYYTGIADRLLPLIADRPLSMRRFPDGIGKDGFYQQNAPDYFPDWIERMRVATEGGEAVHAVCSRQADLAYLANQGTIALHSWLSRSDAIDTPDWIVFDLDPPGEDVATVVRAALDMRDLLDDLGLAAFAKSTGSRGIHVVVPLRRDREFDAVRGFARRVARVLARRFPDRLTVEQRKDKRRGRLYLDLGRNAYAQLAVAPYSLRAIESAPVAAPLHWGEVESGFDPRMFTIANIRSSLSERGDPWAGMMRRARGLEEPEARLAKLEEAEETG